MKSSSTFKSIKISFLLFFLTTTLFSQYSKERIISNCEICNPSSLVASDLDGDLYQDLLVISRDNGKIFWFENDGNGNYALPITITTKVAFIRSVVTADLNNDGLPDIISASLDKIAWYKNLGNGLFSDQILISDKEDFYKEVIAVDFNLDNQIDIISAGKDIVWYKNQGDESFSNPLRIAEEVSGNGVLAKDIDNDTDLDILYYGNSTKDENKRGFWLLKNSGNNLFNQITDIGFTRSSNSISLVSETGQMQVEDLNNDNKLDVVTSTFGLYWSRNIENEEFDLEEFDRLINHNASNGFNISSYGSIAYFSIDDMNDDSISDLVVAPSTNLTDSLSNIAWYQNDGLGNFGDRNIFSNLPNILALITVDIDGDMDKDIIVSSQHTDQIVAFRNDGKGNFSKGQLIYKSEHERLTAIISADMDNDGDTDILSLTKLLLNKI